MLTDRNAFLLAVIFYGLSTAYSVLLWRKGFRRDDRINYLLLVLAFACHTTAMLMRGWAVQRCPVHNLYEATLFIGWSLAGICLGLSLWRRLRFLTAFAAPVLLGLGVFALMPGLDTPPGLSSELARGERSLHAALTLLSYGAFGLGAVAALMYLTQEHDLKFRKLRAMLSVLPPIQRLERITRRLVWAGFVLLSLGLMVGAHLPRPEGVRYLHDAKVIWSLALWGLYLTLLVVHRWFGQSNRRFAWGVIGMFTFVLLTFWGTSLLSPTHRP